MSSSAAAPDPGVQERSLEALSKPQVDRNALTLAIVAALIAGACFGSMTADFSARSTDIGYEASGLGDALTGALFLGGLLNALVSLISLANARANHAFLIVLGFGSVCAAPVGSGLTRELLPVWWDVECSQDNARACYAVKRVADGIEADKKLCSQSYWDQRPCERILEKDRANRVAHCQAWRAECNSSSAYANGKCEVASRHCSTVLGIKEAPPPSAPSYDPSDDGIDDD